MPTTTLQPHLFPQSALMRASGQLEEAAVGIAWWIIGALPLNPAEERRGGGDGNRDITTLYGFGWWRGKEHGFWRWVTKEEGGSRFYQVNLYTCFSLERDRVGGLDGGGGRGGGGGGGIDETIFLMNYYMMRSLIG